MTLIFTGKYSIPPVPGTYNSNPPNVPVGASDKAHYRRLIKCLKEYIVRRKCGVPLRSLNIALHDQDGVQTDDPLGSWSFKYRWNIKGEESVSDIALETFESPLR